MNKGPKSIGDVTTGIILASLLKSGRVVLLPFGDNQRYDLVIDNGGAFLRVQCKTGRLDRSGSVIAFDTCSSLPNGKHRCYRGEVELFGVYCPGNGKAYLVPVEDLPRKTGHLRLLPTKNGQASAVRWAKTYEMA